MCMKVRYASIAKMQVKHVDVINNVCCICVARFYITMVYVDIIRPRFCVCKQNIMVIYNHFYRGLKYSSEEIDISSVLHDKLTSESVLQFLVNKEPRECFLSDIMELDTDTLQRVFMNN